MIKSLCLAIAKDAMQKHAQGGIGNVCDAAKDSRRDASYESENFKHADKENEKRTVTCRMRESDKK